MNIFYYSLLQYTPSEGSGECVNIGVVAIFPETGNIRFTFPGSLKRLTDTFSGAPDKVVKHFLKSISKRSKAVSGHPELPQSYSKEDGPKWFIDHFLLLPDASSLRFSDTRKSVVFGTEEEIIADLNGQFLSNYISQGRTERTDERELKRSFEQQLKAIHPGLLRKIDKKQPVLKVDGINYRFDYQWQNGRANFVKAISFDVAQAETIQRKTERYFGQLTLLSPEANDRKLHFDLLLARPDKKSLFKQYDRSLHVLEKLQHTSLYEGKEGIQRYSEQAAKYLLEEL